MKSVSITVMRMAHYEDLIEKYENIIEHACDMQLGRVFISKDAACPQGFCPSAWSSLAPFVMALACGAKDFYDGWMKNPSSAMLSCNDGFRPVSFLVQTIED